MREREEREAREQQQRRTPERGPADADARAQNAPSARNVAVVSLKPRRQPKPSRPN